MSAAALLRKIIPERWRPIGHLTYLAQVGTGQKIMSGPFAGTRYPASSFFSAYIPKLLGIYERELAGAVEAACAKVPSRVVDVGAAEGYYAAGLARRLPGARVIAFEMQPEGRAALAETLALNHLTDRVEVRGRCEPADLTQALAGADRALVVCDVEGYEQTLLNPTAVPALSGADILVELHEFVVRGVGAELEKRFQATHRVTVIQAEERQESEFPFHNLYTRLLPRSYREWSVSEWRPEQMSWLWMEAAHSV